MSRAPVRRSGAVSPESGSVEIVVGHDVMARQFKLELRIAVESRRYAVGKLRLGVGSGHSESIASRRRLADRAQFCYCDSK